MDYGCYDTSNDHIIPVTVLEHFYELQVPMASKKSGRHKGYTYFDCIMDIIYYLLTVPCAF